VDEQPDLPQYLADGTLERHLADRYGLRAQCAWSLNSRYEEDASGQPRRVGRLPWRSRAGETRRTAIRVRPRSRTFASTPCRAA
jgi:hypothetical protein